MFFCIANKTNSNLSSIIKQGKHKHNNIRVNKLENMFSQKKKIKKKTQKHDTQFYYKYYSPFICIFI